MTKFFNFTFLAALLLSSAACIKSPDDGMTLGEETTKEAVDKALYDAQSGVPEKKAFHTGDNGVIESMETVFSSTSLKETDVYTITSIDLSYIYYDDYKVKANTTVRYKSPRLSASQNPAPTPNPLLAPIDAPTPAASPASVAKKNSLFSKLVTFVSHLKSKITFQPSTALGESSLNYQSRKLSVEDIRVEKKLKSLISSYKKDVKALADSPTTYQYFGLQVYTHPYITNNCSQIKDCKVTATHVEFNQVTTTDGKTTQVHWIYEISKEVPGLLAVMSRCGSSIAIINDSQIPFMECENLDTFHFGSGPEAP